MAKRPLSSTRILVLESGRFAIGWGNHAARLTTDFAADRERSREVTLAAWRRRPILEKLAGSVAWILERQQ